MGKIIFEDGRIYWDDVPYQLVSALAQIIHTCMYHH